jgi:curved DNA-binding protein CbpA
MASDPSNRRKYTRHRAPKGMWVGWKSAGQTSVSRAEDVGLGGLFLHAANPPSKGSIIELVFDLPSGQVRAQGIVRRSVPEKGMGVQFIQMRPDDRAKVHQYMSQQEVAEAAFSAMRDKIEESTAPIASHSQLAISPRSDRRDQFRFERELSDLIKLTGKGTYYQLLEVSSESSSTQVKKSYYALARKFHPDRIGGNHELLARLKNLMPVITEAYKTLVDQEKRAEYDRRLATTGAFSMHREKTKTEESLEEWTERANQCLRAKNFAGSVVWLRKCVEAAPQNAAYRALLARSFATIPEYHNEAAKQFQQAIHLDPWADSAYMQFAELLEEMGLTQRARSVYAKLLEIVP